MKSVNVRRAQSKPPVISKQGEEILRAIYFYRYMTALDVAQLLYSPSSLKYVRGRLSALSGNADFKTNEYLYRFKLPSGGGNTKRIYTLGSRGRDFLASEVGLPVSWYYRPEKVRHMSYGQMMHNLVLTRFLVAANRWSRSVGGYNLATVRTCYELGNILSDLESLPDGKVEKLNVVPDGWLLFEELKGDKHLRFRPVLLEIDRGTEYQTRFKKHIEDRLAFIDSGLYSRLFETEAVTIAYLTSGETPEYLEARRRSMCTWTKEVLEKLDMQSWAGVFRFHSVTLDDMYDSALFERPVWYGLDPVAPVGLFAG